jgi:arylsulfatase A-like enzyme
VIMKNTPGKSLSTFSWGICAAMVLGWVMSVSARPTQAQTADKPNFIIIFTDDQGYQDVGCFGSPSIKTPRLDQMAKEGMRFTDFYAQTVCGPSRSSLLTGCYPLRVAKQNNTVEHHPKVHSQEITIAEMLKEVGYTSACFGKWDQAGHSQTRYIPALLPTRQGFDYFFGTPSSNDSFVNLLRNERLIEEKADMGLLTRRYTDEAIAFIKENKAKPFFVYLAHSMPHTKLGASPQFRGSSQHGLYGDVIEEIDWNIGRVLDAIQALGLDHKTYVIFTSDNGPWWIKQEHGGHASPLRGAKTSTWEGGLRVPCIMRAPGRIPANTVCCSLATTMDLLPSLAAISGGRLPQDRVIDGQDISAVMHGQANALSAPRAFYYYQHTHLQAVRFGKWKLHLTRPAKPPWCPNWAPHIDPRDVIKIEQPLLFDLENDIGESTDLAGQHGAVVEKLLDMAEWARDDIGDYNRIGKNARFFDAQTPRPDIGKWLKP